MLRDGFQQRADMMYAFAETFGSNGEYLIVSMGHRFEVGDFAAHADGAGAGPNIIGAIVQTNAAGGDELRPGVLTAQGLQVTGVAVGEAGEYLDCVRAAGGGDLHFGWSQCAGEDCQTQCSGGMHRFGAETGRNNELCAGLSGDADSVASTMVPAPTIIESPHAAATASKTSGAWPGAKETSITGIPPCRIASAA